MDSDDVSPQVRSRGRPLTSRDAQESLQTVSTLPGQSQGRVPKRTFRSTMNAVEQYARLLNEPYCLRGRHKLLLYFLIPPPATHVYCNRYP
jgi:hypothetical protein